MYTLEAFYYATNFHTLRRVRGQPYLDILVQRRDPLVEQVQEVQGWTAGNQVVDSSRFFEQVSTDMEGIHIRQFPRTPEHIRSNLNWYGALLKVQKSQLAAGCQCCIQLCIICFMFKAVEQVEMSQLGHALYS